jgi:hypothetical protein
MPLFLVDEKGKNNKNSALLFVLYGKPYDAEDEPNIPLHKPGRISLSQNNVATNYTNCSFHENLH